jgi:hypothetical protein
MSYYDNEVPYREVDVIKEKDHHHHHDHGGGSKYWIFWGGCIFLIIIIFFVVIVSGTNWWKVDRDWNHSRTLEHEVAMLSQKLSYATSINRYNDKIHLLSSVYQSDLLIPLSLCHLQLYYTLTDPDKSNESLRVLNHPAQHTIFKDLDYYYYVLDTKIDLTFNINNSNNPFQDEIEISPENEDRFMSLVFNIKTNYHKFSTIKFVEIGLDSKNYLLKTKRETIVCSNNVIYKSKHRCDLLNNRKETEISYTKLLNMFINDEDDENENNDNKGRSSSSSSSHRRKSDNKPHPNNARNNDDDLIKNTPIPSHSTSYPTKEQEYDLDEFDNNNNKKTTTINNNKIIKGSNNLNDIRYFTLIFYEEHKQNGNSSGNGASSSSSGHSKNSRISQQQQNFQESILLTIELNKCN